MSIFLAVMGTIIGLSIYYVRTISVLVDERKNTENDAVAKTRYRWLYWVSAQMESAWPVVESMEAERWAKRLAKFAFFMVFVLLIFAGLFKEFIVEYAGFFLVVLLGSMSISNGPDSLEVYKKMKPYLPVIFPAAMYQAMSLLETQNPGVAHQLVLPGYGFMETKLLAALVGFIMVFVIPYPLAVLDSLFSRFIAKSTLYFIQDFMRLGVKPKDDVEISLRKVAKETIAVTLHIILAILGGCAYLSHRS